MTSPHFWSLGGRVHGRARGKGQEVKLSEAERLFEERAKVEWRFAPMSEAMGRDGRPVRHCCKQLDNETSVSMM